jgi:hypothetical protein
MNSEISKIFSDVGRDSVEALFKEVNPIYCDMECLLDYRFTALLCLMTEADYEIIKANMNVYNDRSTLSTVKSFPGISVTDDMITEYLKKPTNLAEYAIKLQATSYVKIFTNFARGINNKNFLNGHKNPLQIYIGCNGLPTPMIFVKQVEKMLSDNIPGLSLQFTPHGIVEYPKGLARTFKHFSIYNFEKTIGNDNFNMHLADGSIAFTSVHAFPFITSKQPGDPITLLANQNLFLNIVFDFNYEEMDVNYERRNTD